MGKHYPLLDREQVEAILRALNFNPKRQGGTSHCQWEGYTKGLRRIVTVDHLKKGRKEKYTHRLMSKMIQQSGISKDEFYSNF